MGPKWFPERPRRSPARFPWGSATPILTESCRPQRPAWRAQFPPSTEERCFIAPRETARGRWGDHLAHPGESFPHARPAQRKRSRRPACTVFLRARSWAQETGVRHDPIACDGEPDSLALEPRDKDSLCVQEIQSLITRPVGERRPKMALEALRLRHELPVVLVELAEGHSRLFSTLAGTDCLGFDDQEISASTRYEVGTCGVA